MAEYNLTRKQFADKLEITTDTLKKRMKRGHYKSSYIFENGKYLFNGQEAVRPIIDKSRGQMSPEKGIEAITSKANILILRFNKRMNYDVGKAKTQR